MNTNKRYKVVEKRGDGEKVTYWDDVREARYYAHDSARATVYDTRKRNKVVARYSNYELVYFNAGYAA